MPDGVAAARNLGIHLEDAGAEPFRGIRFCEDGESVAATFPTGRGLGIRRTALHQLMVDHAAAAGVRMIWGAPIKSLDSVRARWIVGADGGNSRVRRWAGLEAAAHDSRRYGFRRQYRIAPWSDYMELNWSDACQLYITPVAPDEVCVVLISSDPTLRLDDALPLFPAVKRRLDGASATMERGGVSASHRLRRVANHRVALAGDASGSVDAITGEGLGLLFRQAVALAAALESGELVHYQAEHRRIGRRAEFMANAMLLLDGHRRFRHRVFRALSSRPQLFARMLAMHVGELPPFDAVLNGMALGWRMLYG